MSRLDYAPKLKEIQVTDIQKGLGLFTPKPDKPVSFAALKATLKSAGYTLDSADITVAGTLAKDEQGWAIVVKPSGQKLALEGPNVDQALAGAAVGSQVEITGDWNTIGAAAAAHEAIAPAGRKANARRIEGPYATSFANFAKAKFIASYAAASVAPDALIMPEPGLPAAPIRVTSPGLTVYKGGAFTPRLYFIKQHLGALEVNRQVLELSVSYTPSPRLQVEIEAPFSRTGYDNRITSGSGFGIGNLTGWRSIGSSGR